MIRLLLCTVYLLPLLLRLSITDIRTKELENICIILILPAFFGFSVKIGERLLAFALPLIMTPFFGFGDIMLMQSLGFVTGLSGLCFISISASLMAGFYGLILIITKKKKRGDALAYAPFLSIGYIIYVLSIILN